MNALLEIDRRWTARLRLPEDSRLLRALAGLLAHSGDSWFWGAALALVWWVSGPPERSFSLADSWSLRMFVAIAVTALIVTSLKFLIRRQRPAGEWGSIYRKADPHSFPSGHAARGALIAALIAGWGPTWMVPISLVWAPLMPLARVAMGLHYLSDTIAGAAFGLLVALGFLLYL
jgi:undecaprenyl-diphosphatase